MKRTLMPVPAIMSAPSTKALVWRCHTCDQLQKRQVVHGRNGLSQYATACLHLQTQKKPSRQGGGEMKLPVRPETDRMHL
jgi:hypothetical protein